MSKVIMTEAEYNKLLDQFITTHNKIGFEYAVKEAFNTVYQLLYELSEQIEAMRGEQNDQIGGEDI